MQPSQCRACAGTPAILLTGWIGALAAGLSPAVLAPAMLSPAVLVPAVLAPAVLSPAVLSAQQEAVVDRDENFRAEPNGTVIGELRTGTRLEVTEERGDWARVTLEGFVWLRSMQVEHEGEFDLIISEPGGENIRDEPAGRVAGTFVQGARLTELERLPGWGRVRRSGWIWAPSISVSAPVAADRDPPADGGPRLEAPPPPATAGTDPEEALAIPLRWLTVGGGGLPVLAAPDGDTLGRVGGGSELSVLEREGNWSRVRLEGWVWTPDAGQAGDREEEAGGILVDVSPAELRAEPERFRGRRIQIHLQFISLERAEAIRTDFYEGEPFVLTRAADGERGFVYVAVPRERVGEVEGLAPLENLRVVARVRTGAAAFTGNPVLDLIELERVR